MARTNKVDQRALWLRHSLLAPYAAEPLGLALASILALMTVLTPHLVVLGSVVAATVAIRLVIRTGQRTAIAVSIKARRVLELVAAVGALSALGLAAWLHILHADVVRVWLVDLSGWRDPRLWLVQLALPGIFLLMVFGLPTRRVQRKASPFLQAYLFGHRPGAYVLTFLWRTTRLPLLVLVGWFLGPSAAADAAIATAERMQVLSAAVANAGGPAPATPTGAAMTTDKANKTGRAAWQGWQAAPLSQREAVADGLPTLLLQRSGPIQVALVDAWLGPAIGQGSRSQFLDRLFRLDVNPKNTAKTPTAAVWRGLRARCETTTHEGQCAARPPPRRTLLRRLGLDQEAAVVSQLRPLLSRARGWHALLGPWARHHGLCPTSLATTGWDKQARTLFITTLCHGDEASEAHAATVLGVVAATPTNSFRWQVPGRAGVTLDLTARPTKQKGGPNILMHRPAGTLRDVTDLADLVIPSHVRSEPLQHEDAEERAGKSPRWRREQLHMWTIDADLTPRWAGVVVLDRASFLRGRCSFTGRGCNGGPRLGVQVRQDDTTNAAGERGLKVWRISHAVPSCHDRRLGGVHCARAEFEGRALRGVQVRHRDKTGVLVQQNFDATALLTHLTKGSGRRRRALRRTQTAVRKGRTRWLADLLAPLPTAGRGNTAEVTLLLEGDARMTLRPVHLAGNDVVPVIRLVFDQQVMIRAAQYRAPNQESSGQGSQSTATGSAGARATLPPCQAEARLLHLVHARGNAQRWHAVSLDESDQWYKRFAGKPPTRPLCVLAPILPYIRRSGTP